MTLKGANERGMALLLVLLTAIVIVGAVALVVGRVHVAKQRADAAVISAELDEACKGAVDFAVERIWHRYLIGNGNTTGNLASYRVFINGVVDNNEDINRNGTRDDNEGDANGNGDFETADALTLASAEEPLTLGSGCRITNLTIDRFDDVTGTNMTIRATASKGGQSRTALQTIRVAGQLFQGFEYGILANNINCVLCHADFLNLDLRRNTDPGKFNTFDRIKIAALESLLIRESEADSRVAGTVYTRGRVYNNNGAELGASSIERSSFDAFRFSTDNGKLAQNDSGGLEQVGLVNAGTTAEGDLEQFANLYMDYPTDHDAMTDGNLPQSFPAPFPDDDGDRYVGDDEFERIMNSADGYISFEMDPDAGDGSIQGGVAYGVPAGSAYSGTGLPTSSNDALAALSSSGYYDGNLILVGTQDDPIVIDKKVAVNGDLVIKGPVKGWGQLLVRGNTYVVGDVTYADAEGTFGQAADGSKNGFALTSGGSVMIGDYTTIRAKNNMKKGPPDYIDPYVWQGHFTRVDAESYNQKMSNGKYTKVGYFDPGVVDAGWPQGAEAQYSFTTSELMLFNRMEHLRALEDPNYTPRYYRLRENAPIYEYITEDVTNSALLEHSVCYGVPGIEVIEDTEGAAIHNLNPADYWMTEDQLRRIWWNDEAERRAKGGRQPWRFDGLLYSNNCIFSVIRSQGRHKSACYGTLLVRGSIVCADLGVLMIDTSYTSTTGLTLDYDKRVSDFLRVEDTTAVEFRRIAFRFDNTSA